MKTENTRLCAATIERCEREQTERLTLEREKHSTAETFKVSQKQVETWIRHACYKRGLYSTADFRARTAGKADLYLYFEGRRYVGEVKSGGTVGDAIPEWDESDILPKAQYVIFPVMDHIEDEDDVMDNSLILSRAEFLSLLAACSRKGIHGTVHAVISQKRPPVLAFQPKPLAALRRMAWKMIEAGEAYTVRDYLVERGL